MDRLRDGWHDPVNTIAADWRIWRDDVPRGAAENMALDEALLELTSNEAAPLLRLYRWAEPAVSFGYFDRLAVVQARFPDRTLVRRWTGGGAVDHAADVTFALAAPRSHPLGVMTALESYRAIHGVVVEALRRAGIDAVLAGAGGLVPDDSSAVCAPLPPAARGEIDPCFVRPVCADVLSAGRKVAGGAQRRTRGGLLHQGSIQGIGDAPVREQVRLAFADLCGGGGLEIAGLEERALTIASERYARAEWLARWG